MSHRVAPEQEAALWMTVPKAVGEQGEVDEEMTPRSATSQSLRR